MLKRTVTYQNYNGDEVTEDLYFNLTKAEIVDMELSTNGGLSTLLNRIVNTKNIPEAVKVIKEILTKSYGKKSDDGNRFIKNQQLIDDFVASPAYTKLYMELVFDAEAGAKFITGIVPPDMVNELQKEIGTVAEKNGAIPFPVSK